MAATFLLAACGTAVDNTNWPGMMAIGDVVYLAYGPGVIALDLQEKEELWRYRPQDVGNQVQLFAEPSVVEQSVVVGDYGDSGGFLNPRITVGIYGLNDGELVPSGRTNRPKNIWQNKEAAADRIIASPLQVGDTAYVGTADNIMLAIDQSAGGSVIWQFETGKPVWSRPVYDDGVLYMGSMDGLAYSLNAENGSQRWSQDLGGAISANIVFENGLLYMNSYNQSANALDPSSGAIIWTIDTSTAVWGASAVSGDELYLVDLDGTVYALDAMTGKIRWTEEIGEVVQAGPAIGNGIVYVVTTGDPEVDSDERNGSVVALSMDNGDVLWNEQVQQRLYTPPIVVGESVLVALNEGDALLLEFDGNDGRLTWTFPRPSDEEE